MWASTHHVIPQFPELKSIDWQDREDIEHFTKGLPPYSDFNFTSMYVWDVHGTMKVSQLHGNLIVLFSDYMTGEQFFSFLGTNLVTETARVLFAYSTHAGYCTALRLIPETVAQLISTTDFEIVSDRDSFDYLYEVDDLYRLVELPNAYEPARKARQFIRNYPNYTHTICQMDDLCFEQVRAVYKKWAAKKGVCYEESIEYRAFKRHFYNALPTHFITLIYMDFSLIGFMCTEVISSEFAVSHFAKADISFKGIYDVLIWHTGAMLHERKIGRLNFEQDLGIANLRHSKETHTRHSFLKKYCVYKM